MVRDGGKAVAQLAVRDRWPHHSQIGGSSSLISPTPAPSREAANDRKGKKKGSDRKRDYSH
jgi:hypothetical protein